MSYAYAAWEAIISGEGLLLAAWFVFSLLVIAVVDGDDIHRS
jgi:hypothetical protein